MEPRNERVTIRLTEEERIWIRSESERLGIPCSGLIRRGIELYSEFEANADMYRKGELRYGRKNTKNLE